MTVEIVVSAIGVFCIANGQYGQDVRDKRIFFPSECRLGLIGRMTGKPESDRLPEF